MISQQEIEKINTLLADKFDIDKQTGNFILKPEIAEQLKMPQFEMIFVQGGKFIMGDNNGEYDSEKPEHEVELSSYFMAKFQVTQEFYEAVIGKNPSIFNGKNRPVENVSWYDSVKFSQKLNKILKLAEEPVTGSDDNVKLDLTKAGFRLPTEAEWEYAAKQYKYAGSDSVQQVAWFGDNSNETKPVGLRLPNSLGIYDMSGNVVEWCWDWFDEDYYKESSNKNPKGASKGSSRVMRGGSWDYDAVYCRVALRNINTPDRKWYYRGFRLVFAF